MNKSVETWENLERAVAALEKAAANKPKDGDQAFKAEALEHIDKLIHKLEEWCKL